VVIGDVAGKGIPAALLMAMTRSMVRSSLQQADNNVNDLSKMVQSVNNSLSRENLNGKFVTALLYIIDLKEMKIHFLSAGHTPLYIFRPRENRFQSSNEGGLPFGILEGEQYHNAVMDIKPGDILTVYTDGITEAQDKNGQLFGYQRLQDVIRIYANQDAQTIRNAIIDAVETFAQGMAQFDDLTLVVAKIGD
jgi:sigma-B regulation protein RsbU (phosphoserine phosphatase)